jgi:isopentenyl phosphate kinase
MIAAAAARAGEASVALVKLGGSLITDKRRPQAPRHDVLARLAREVAKGRAASAERLLLGHGSGSYGHVAAAAAGIDSGVHDDEQLLGFAITQSQAAKLHRLVIEELLAAAVPVFSFSPSSAMIGAGARPTILAIEPIVSAFALGLVPVTYGDVMLDRVQGGSICSTEAALSLLARRLPRHGLPVKRILWLGETDGIYDADGDVIGEVNERNLFAARRAIGAAAGTDVTGGMKLRLETAWRLARRGIRSVIANGLVAGRLETWLRGEEIPGTRVG